jgi:hypothetical protein
MHETALFKIVERYSPSRMADVVTHVSQAGRQRHSHSKNEEAAS